MPALPHVPPKPGSYRRIMQRADKDISFRMVMPAYDETAQSYAVAPAPALRNPQGREKVQTLFCKSRNTAFRAEKYGWVDVTESWLEAHAGPARERLLAVMDDEFRTKRELLKLAGLPETSWRRAIRELVDDKLAKSKGSGHNMTYRLA